MSLIQIAAFYGSLNIFKFLFIQKNIEFNKNLLSYAYAGENIEIIHLCEQKCKIEKAYFQPIFIHRQDFLDYCIENYENEINNDEISMIKNILKNFVINEDNIYEILNYESLSCSLFASNFDVFEKCLRKIIFIVRNYDNLDNIIFQRDYSLICNCLFDFELFKFLYSQRKPQIEKLKIGSYFLAMMNSALNNANDTLKFLFFELKENKLYCYECFRIGLRFNHDFANFILDFQLNENHEDQKSLFHFFKSKIDLKDALNAIKWYNEDIVVKMIQLYDIINDSRIRKIFVRKLMKNLSKKMVLSLFDRLSPILPSDYWNDIKCNLKEMGYLEIFEYIKNNISHV